MQAVLDKLLDGSVPGSPQQFTTEDGGLCALYSK